MTPVHLISADQMATWHSECVAVCGELVQPAAPAAEDPTYCADCVRAAAAWNARAGREVAAALT